MTDLGGGDTRDAARAARLAQLQQRHTATTPRSPGAAAHRAPRAGDGSGSKVAAAGLGFASMLGLVASMAVAARPTAPASPGAAQLLGAPQQVVVLLHRPDGTTTSDTGSSHPPIALRAQPTVRPAARTQVPSGRTNGSR